MGADSPGRTVNYWVSILRDGIVVDEASDVVLRPLIRHLADLGAFEYCGDDLWALAKGQGTASGEGVSDGLSRHFVSLAQEKNGFILKYFSREVPADTEFDLPAKGVGFKKSGGSLKISADLSNYQIVRKMGRQLSPFIELENDIVNRLEGRRVTRSDAKILFKFVFSKMRTMAKPRQWEQISRRRHK